MVGSKTQSLQRHEIERLGGVIPDNRHISPGTAYIPEKEVMRVKAAARRDGVEVTRLNDYDKDIGGGLYRFEKTTTFESEKDMKKLNENTKVTLTLEQLKRLVKEGDEWSTPDSDFRCCWCGEPVDMDTAHNVGHDIYCDDCFREQFYHKKVNEEFDTDDGWDCDEIRDSGLMDTLRKCANVEYNLRTCIRTAASWGDTLADLKAYINELAEEMQNAVANFPDEDEEVDYPPEAMGDDEEIEVME